MTKARGRDEGHDHAEEATRITDKVDGLEVVQMDYTYMEDIKILSLYATGHHGGEATAVERKGPYPWIAMWITKRLSAMVIETCRLRTDPEESTVAVAKQVQHKWMSKMILEKTPVASHQSIGGVERYRRMLQDEVRTIKLECEKNLEMVPSGAAAATWIVRHASWLIYRYHKNNDLKSTCFARDRGVAYSGSLVGLFESVLARAPGAEERGTGRSKWQTRWIQGVWLGRAEDSDTHIVYDDGKVGEHRTIRRFAVTDPRRWGRDAVKNLTVTPWRLQDTEIRAQAAVAMTREPSRANLVGAGLMTPAAAAARAERVVPLKQRPSTPGCAACSKRGQPGHGFRHSVECHRRRQTWLET